MRALLANERHRLPNVAIVGRPNVGKSALFNRLAGRKIAIVHDQPGITRDRLSATCTRGERAFTLWDTGGIFGAGESELIQQVRHAAEDALRDSDVLLFVVDGKEGLSPIDREVGTMLRKAQKPVVLVINKIDTNKHEQLTADFDSLGFEHTISVSAEHDRGISDLLDAIDSRVPSSDHIDGGKPKTETPIAIAIVGRPNVGKSSLINSIVRGERAIVSELPGTTRDAIDIRYESGSSNFVFIDTAGIRRRGKVSSSAEVFSVMRAERSIRRADLSILVVDLTMGVTAQDKRIAGLIQKERKPSIIVLNKWDLIAPRRGQSQSAKHLIEEARSRIFFLNYALMIITSASTGENIDRLFALIGKIRSASRKRIGTGVLNRLLRQAFEANPPPLVKGKRLKLFYAVQTKSGGFAAIERSTRHKEHKDILEPPEFILFVNDPALMGETYQRYLETRIRHEHAYPGLPITLRLRPRTTSGTPVPRSRRK